MRILGRALTQLGTARLDCLLVAQHFKSLPLIEWTEVLGSEHRAGSARPGLYGLSSSLSPSTSSRRLQK
jgi:hypothetical protein